MDISYCNYDDINEEVLKVLNSDEKYDMYFITDISVSDEIAKKIDNRDDSYKFVLLDHHPTALELNKYDWCNVIIENNGIKTCGTELFYQWLKNYEMFDSSNKCLDNFIQIVRDYDTWRWSILGEKGIICKQVNDLLYLYGRDEFIKWCINELYDEVFPKLYAKDELVLKIKQDEIDKYVESKNEQMFTIPLCGKTCGVVYSDRNVSELGNRLCQMHPEIDFVVMIDLGNATVAYRTVKDNIDLGRDVAALYGGGGHPKAAGSKFNDEMRVNISKYVFGIGE